MKKRRTSRSVLAAITAVAAVTSVTSFAQTPPPAPKGWQFAGVWAMMGSPVRLSSDPVFTPQGKAEADEQTRKRTAGDIAGDTSAECIPPVMPTMTTIGVQELLVDAKKITWISESSNSIRWIWTDGRAHPALEEIRPTAGGHSVAKWEGDTLVVDTVAFMPKSKMYVNRLNNEMVTPSPKMRVVERLSLAEGGKVLVNERTVEDPAILAQPWKTTVRYQRRDDFEIGEMICAENNRIGDY